MIAKLRLNYNSMNFSPVVFVLRCNNFKVF